MSFVITGALGLTNPIFSRTISKCGLACETVEFKLVNRHTATLTVDTDCTIIDSDIIDYHSK